MEDNEKFQKSHMIIYTTEDGLTKIETKFDEETVWLSIDQMAELFQRDRSVIGKHVRNVFKEGELAKESVWAKFAYTATDGKVRKRVKKNSNIFQEIRRRHSFFMSMNMCVNFVKM